MKNLILLFALFMLTACSLKNTSMYGSENLSPAERAVISSVGTYADRKLSLQIFSINGEKVDMDKTASFLVPQGTYKIGLQAIKDAQVVSGAPGLAFKSKGAKGEVSLVVRSGHTYIPNAVVAGDTIKLYFDDAGKDYPTECLPLYKTVNSSSNPGLKLYQTEKKCRQ